MEENKLAKYEGRELQKVGYALKITNKIFALTQKDQIHDFFLENPNFFKLIISKHYSLSDQLLQKYEELWYWDEIIFYRKSTSVNFIEKHQDKLDWGRLSYNNNLLWSENLIEKFYHKWDWAKLSGNKSLPWTTELIEKYNKKWDWSNLSWNETLPWTTELVEKYVRNWNWTNLSSNKGLPWSEIFIMNYSNKWSWVQLGGNESLPWSESFFEKYLDKWNWATVSYNRSLPWSINFIEKYIQKWEIAFLCINEGLPWSDNLINYLSQITDGKCYCFFSQESFPWSEQIIEKHISEWNWEHLSSNIALPWSETFIEKYRTKWDKKGLSLNIALPWTLNLVKTYIQDIKTFESQLAWNPTIWKKIFKPTVSDEMIENIMSIISSKQESHRIPEEAKQKSELKEKFLKLRGFFK